ncbi:MAG TPA: aldehyde dehydrogenase, partial [Alphaproteobacteria bacterium]|nr:aldehyde dehydrogenase [Alphaproteobacteria bacterium]
MQIKPYWQNYINGEFVDAANRLKIENPADGSDLAEIAQASAGDIGRAVDAARACHESGVLTDMRPVELGRMVRGIGDWILDHKDRIAEVLTLEAGKPYWESLIEVEGA